jgi:hypothetical protein
MTQAYSRRVGAGGRRWARVVAIGTLAYPISIAGLFKLWAARAAWAALFEVVGELGGVLGGEALQIR